MKKLISGITALLLALSIIPSAHAGFVIGGENGWQLSTDGIVDVFSTYNTTSPVPGGTRFTSLLSDTAGANTASPDQRFGVGIGLLPSVVAFNVKAPTTNGVDSSVRVGIYPAIQNKSGTRFDTSPNIDFREFFYTAKGAYGELLAGRALNLYQGKNILTDMTLLTAGVVPSPGLRGNTTLGHIGYGYLYANFGPQIRYTTPDINGVKVALAVGEPYKVSSDTGKTNTPRVETEISYAGKIGNTTLQAWASGLFQNAPRSDAAAARPGANNQSLGGAAGVSTGFSGVNLLLSGYLGKGLGMVSAQDGDAFGSTATDGAGVERLHWGFLAQATYKLTPDVMLGVNYGQSRQNESDFDISNRGNYGTSYSVPISKQEAATATVTYNFNKFTQFVAEYTYAQNTWHDSATQHSNQFAVGTMFYW
ncbi:hypothetical protein KI809_12370 [Geobacter pelophilus]|uniref:Porin n=1 Tax=Geoanaerobacter pelophilus TaxID=60036 RepID=A0AAW4L7S1_9BACT|nr:hypothetical protein [Geoanaerobacter pelophilus]MBT0665093.1 hypothetical protein [Geoanaerobacter pelophilus]